MSLVSRYTAAFPVDDLRLAPRHPLSSFHDGSLFVWTITPSDSAGLLTAYVCTRPSIAAPQPQIRAVACVERAAAFSALAEVSGRAICGAADGSLFVYDVARDAPGVCQETNQAKLATASAVSSLCVLVGGTQAVAAQETGHLSLLDDCLVATSSCRVDSCVRSVAANSPFVTSCATVDGSIYQWDVRTGGPTSAARVAHDSLAHISVSSADPSLLLTSATSGIVRLHDVRAMQRCVSSAPLGSGPVRASFESNMSASSGTEMVLACTNNGALLSLPVTLDSSEVLIAEQPSRAALTCAAYERSLRMLLCADDTGIITCSVLGQ